MPRILSAAFIAENGLLGRFRRTHHVLVALYAEMGGTSRHR